LIKDLFPILIHGETGVGKDSIREGLASIQRTKGSAHLVAVELRRNPPSGIG